MSVQAPDDGRSYVLEAGDVDVCPLSDHAWAAKASIRAAFIAAWPTVSEASPVDVFDESALKSPAVLAGSSSTFEELMNEMFSDGAATP